MVLRQNLWVDIAGEWEVCGSPDYAEISIVGVGPGLDSGSGEWEAGARILEEVSLLEAQPGGQEICVTYPRGELDTRRRDEMTLVLGALSVETAVPVAPSMGSGAWTSLALQLGPDGTIEIFVDHQLVHTSRWKALFDADARWRVVIAGAAVDTQLLLRNLTVTRGARF